MLMSALITVINHLPGGDMMMIMVVVIIITTENCHIGHCAQTSESADVKVH
jgi:hypothetical protein